MHVLGCMLDGKGTWGWLCMCTLGADVCACECVGGGANFGGVSEVGSQQFFTQ